MPELYIITGSNGAGKSSFGGNYLPDPIRTNYTIFDGDKLFEQKRKEFYSTVAPVPKEARKLAGEWLENHFQTLVNKAIDHNDHFAFEGHFREESTWDLVQRFKAQGYRINMIFMGLRDQALSQLRVVKRAEFGGHNVPEHEIDLNFRGNLIMLDAHFNLIDELSILDTSDQEPKLLLHFSEGEVKSCVPVKELPDWFRKYLPDITKISYSSLKESPQQEKKKRRGRRK